MAAYEDLKSELLAIAKVLEGFPEAVKPKVFDLLVSTYLGADINRPPMSPPPDIPPASQSPHKKGTRRAKRGGTQESTEPVEGGTPKATKQRGKESYSIDRNLNLRGDKSIPSFKQFLSDKQPSSAKEFNAVVVYYLQKMLGIGNVTLDQAYTCYVEASRRPPEAFKQSFTDTKNREGWIEFDSEGNLKIPHRGSVFVEHDLPKPPKAPRA